MSYINVIVEEEDYIRFGKEGFEDIKVEVFRSEKSTYVTLDAEPIVLDENGKEYVLTFCCVDYGGGGCAGDAIYDYSFIFKINETQVEILKTLVGYIGKGVEVPSWGINYKKGINPKSKAFEKVENTLKIIGDSKTLLKQMDFNNDNLFSDSHCYLNEVK